MLGGERGGSSKHPLDPPRVRFCEKFPFFVESKILIINENWLNRNHAFVYLWNKETQQTKIKFLRV